MDAPKKVHASVIVKAGFWYTICTFLLKGLAFITIPLFTRIMSKADIGYYGNFTSWISILSVFTSLDLAQSIIRFKLELEEDLDSYIWSSLSLSSIITGVVYAVFCVFSPFFVNLLNIDEKYFHILFLYLLTAPAFQMFITKQRAFYKYKTFVILTAIASLLATVTSVAFVLLFSDKISGRIYGHYLPFVVIGVTFYIIIACKGKKIKTQHWKYALTLCLPLVPHVLSMHLLSASDRIIITRLCGAEFTAVYTIAYSVHHIVSTLFHSLNKAWAPWLLDNLHIQNYEEIRSVSKKYVGVFWLFIIPVFLLGPEIIWILGGKNYSESVLCIPPLIASCVIQLIYTMYVNVEFYKKKTIGVSAATMIAATINIALNFWIIPLFPERGYVVAAYTTLVGYFVLFVFHYILVKRMRMDHVFDVRFLIVVIFLTLIIAIVVDFLYKAQIIRYIITGVYLTGLFAVFMKYRKMIFRLLGKNKA